MSLLSKKLPLSRDKVQGKNCPAPCTSIEEAGEFKLDLELGRNGLVKADVRPDPTSAIRLLLNALLS